MQCIMYSFFEIKRLACSVGDMWCRNILLSLHFLSSRFSIQSNPDQSWRVITKKYTVSFQIKIIF